MFIITYMFQTLTPELKLGPRVQCFEKIDDEDGGKEVTRRYHELKVTGNVTELTVGQTFDVSDLGFSE